MCGVRPTRTEQAMSAKRVDRSDDPHLMSVQRKTALLRDKLRAVYLGYKTGVLIWGAGGSGKSWTIEDEARATGVVLRRSTGVLTPRALFDQLRRHPQDVHLIEDNEQLLTKDDAVTVLREATWTVERVDNLRDDGRFPDRRVTWGRYHEPADFIFLGGIVIAQNEKPPTNSRVAALLTRLRPFELAVTDAELLTLARHLAATAPPRIMGYQLSPDECTEVLTVLTEEAPTSVTRSICVSSSRRTRTSLSTRTGTRGSTGRTTSALWSPRGHRAGSTTRSI